VSLPKSDESESERMTNASSRIARSCSLLVVALLSDCMKGVAGGGGGGGGGDEPPPACLGYDSAKIVAQLRNA
jgi:hypothetical protein